jgi:thymidylate kinase
MRESPGGMAPLIAVIGTDGSGKSTVCEHIAAWIGRYGPARRVHLGKQWGNAGRWLARLPIVGPALGRRIRSGVDVANDRIKAERQLGLLPALVVSAFTLRRWLRFKRMLALRERGFIVVADRFPQVVFPGAYDGPVFPSTPEGSALVRLLARHERATFERMAAERPDLVLRLNVDIDVACARKPDHRRADLLRKIAVTPLLTYAGAPIVDINANQSLDRVIADAEAAVADLMTRRGNSPRVTMDVAARG